MLTKTYTILESIIFAGKIYIPRKFIQATCYYVVPAVFILIYFFAPMLHHELQESLGEGAKILFLGILFVKPLSVLFRPIGLLRTLVGLRRQAGIVMFYFALFHFLYFAASQAGSPITLLLDILNMMSAYWYGAVALLILTPLFITSNAISTRVLKKWWKRLHRIIYIALPFILLHSAAMEGEGSAGAIALTLFFYALKAVEWYILYTRKRKRQEKKAQSALS